MIETYEDVREVIEEGARRPHYSTATMAENIYDALMEAGGELAPREPTEKMRRAIIGPFAGIQPSNPQGPGEFAAYYKAMLSKNPLRKPETSPERTKDDG